MTGSSVRRTLITFLLTLGAAGCGPEKAGAPAAEAPRVVPPTRSDQLVAEPGVPAESPAVSAAEPVPEPVPGPATPGPRVSPVTPTPLEKREPDRSQTPAKPDVAATPERQPKAAPTAGTDTAGPQEKPVPSSPAVASQPAPAEPADEPAVEPAVAPSAAAQPSPGVAPAAAPIAAAPAPTAPAAEMDLKALEDQLRQTKAIGFMTKLTLKGQVDDLLDRFRDYYQGKATLTMKDLRRSYDLLMMKVLSLIQDEDQQLASAIVASREAIWGLLADPVKFETLQG